MIHVAQMRCPQADGRVSISIPLSHASHRFPKPLIVCQSKDVLSPALHASKADWGRRSFPWLQMSLKKLIRTRILFSLSVSGLTPPVLNDIALFAIFAVL